MVQITYHMQHMSSSNGISVYHGNNRFGNGTDLFLKIKDIQAGELRLFQYILQNFLHSDHLRCKKPYLLHL